MPTAVISAQELYAQAKAKSAEAKAYLLGPNADLDAARLATAEAKALVERAALLEDNEGVLNTVNQPVRVMDFDDYQDGDDGDMPDEQSVIKAANIIRYSNLTAGIDDPTSVVMREVYDGDFRQQIYDQTKAFGRYLRGREAERILTRQFWTPGDVKSMLMSGLDVKEIKATMIEGQDILGGFAVPPQISSDINRRLAGLTAVRAGGARVIRTNSNSIQWLRVEGGNTRYPGNLRGQWGGETATPSEQNMKFGLDRINVDLYTYRLRMSSSLIEDAENIIDIFNEEVSDTLAIDEDHVFLVGDGANQPRGILPGGENAHGLTEVVTGSATGLTVAKVKALRRGVASQYRRPGSASWIGNSETGNVVEQFQDGQGRFYFEYLDNGEQFLRSAWRESEAMPSIAAGNYPLIFGDLSGYAIVERLGLAIRRYNDSYTGINMVEFQIRRRIGGNIWQPWKFAVQKVATS